MTPTCKRAFDEALLTGYLDRALSQRQSQQVRLHLEECEACNQFYQELTALRETALNTRFVAPKDDGWPELPQTTVGRFSRPLGWLLIISWLTVVTGIALWRFLSQTGDPLEIFLVLGLPGGFMLLFFSVLFDRLKDLQTDRYRGIHR